jgi:hypothetical protein
MKYPKIPKKYLPMIRTIEKGDNELSNGYLIVLNDGFLFDDDTQTEYVESYRELIDKLSMIIESRNING